MTAQELIERLGMVDPHAEILVASDGNWWTAEAWFGTVDHRVGVIITAADASPFEIA